MKATVVSFLTIAAGAIASPFLGNSGALPSPNVRNQVLSMEGCDASQKSSIEAAFAKCEVIARAAQIFSKAETTVVEEYFGYVSKSINSVCRLC